MFLLIQRLCCPCLQNQITGVDHDKHSLELHLAGTDFASLRRFPPRTCLFPRGSECFAELEHALAAQPPTTGGQIDLLVIMNPQATFAMLAELFRATSARMEIVQGDEAEVEMSILAECFRVCYCS